MNGILRSAIALGLVAALMPPQPARAQAPEEDDAPERAYTFYRPDVTVGTEGQFGPLNVLMNLGFDVLRQPAYNDNPFERHYGTAFLNVWRNVTNPRWAIEGSGGLGHVVSNEVFPYRGLGESGGQFAPNYSLHLLGEGMVSRKLGEWYAHRGVRFPYAAGIATTFLAQLMNELSENGDFVGPNADPVVDLLMFNVLGYVLFALAPVRHFFATHLRLNFWPDQPAIDLRSGRLVNVGENTAFKIALPWTRARVFAYASNQAMFGLSIPLDRRDTLSLGLGIAVVDLATVVHESGGRAVVIGREKNYEFGAFWDREESLLASIRVGGTSNPHLALNVYPGLVRFGSYSAGLFVVAGRYDGYSLGITLKELPLVPTILFNQDRSLERL